MTAAPLLRGGRAIGAYLDLAPGLVRHKHQVRMLPTMKARSVMCLTPVALDDRRALDRAGELR
jgi:hypothetical protein